MIEENDVVKAKINISDEIKINTIGVVLSVYENGNSFLIEFVDENNKTLENGMTLVKREDIELTYKYPNC